MPSQRKPLPVLADSGYWLFLDFAIRAFLNIQHLASSIDLVKATAWRLSSLLAIQINATLELTFIRNVGKITLSLEKLFRDVLYPS